MLKPVSPPDLLDTVRKALDQAALYRERERLRQDLERSERRHRDLVELAPVFILALDQKGRISIWNRKLEDVTGFSRAEMLGSDGSALVGVDDGPRELPLKTGGARNVRWSCADVTGPDGAPMVYAVGTDVTDENEMLRRTLRAERLAAVGTLAAGLAHEVRNPLNSASLQLAVLERRLEKGDGADRVMPIARIIKGEIDRLDRLVRDFLAFAKPSPLVLRPVELAALLGAVALLMGPEAEAARIAVTVEASPSLPPAAGDTERLRQVVINLTRNAVEAMHERGGRLAPARAERGGPSGGRGRGRRSRLSQRAADLRRVLHDQGPGDRPRAFAGAPDRRRPRRHDPRRVPPRPNLLHLHPPGRRAEGAGPLTLVHRRRNIVTFGRRSEPAASLLLLTIPTGIPRRRASRPARLVGLGVDAISTAVH